jgi:hypothetical protein
MTVNQFIDPIVIANALLLAAIFGASAWIRRLVNQQIVESRERGVDLDGIKEVLLGRSETIWHNYEPGLVEGVARLRALIGSNGGSTLFEGHLEMAEQVNDLILQQAKMLEWAEKHTQESNLSMSILVGVQQVLAETLAERGIVWEPPNKPDFTNPSVS